MTGNLRMSQSRVRKVLTTHMFEKRRINCQLYSKSSLHSLFHITSLILSIEWVNENKWANFNTETECVRSAVNVTQNSIRVTHTVREYFLMASHVAIKCTSTVGTLTFEVLYGIECPLWFFWTALQMIVPSNSALYKGIRAISDTAWVFPDVHLHSLGTACDCLTANQYSFLDQ